MWSCHCELHSTAVWTSPPKACTRTNSRNSSCLHVARRCCNAQSFCILTQRANTSSSVSHAFTRHGALLYCSKMFSLRGYAHALISPSHAHEALHCIAVLSCYCEVHCFAVWALPQSMRSHACSTSVASRACVL